MYRRKSLLIGFMGGLLFLTMFSLGFSADNDSTDVWDTTFTPLSQHNATLKAVAIYATGPNAPFLQQLPLWYDEIFQLTNLQGSVTQYLDEVSFGDHVMEASAFGQNGTTCFVASVDPPWWPWDNWNTWFTFVNDILTAADQVIDFSQFDIEGPGGNPDGVVDFVFFNVCGYGGLHGTNFHITNQYYTGDEFVTNDISPVTQNFVRISENNGMYQHIGNEPLDKEPALSIILHEYGHQLGLDYDLDHSVFTYYNHYSLGGFEVMATLGFEARPSPYSPWFRTYITEWVNPTPVNTNLEDQSLGDFNSTGAVYRIEANVGAPAFADQAFLVSNHQQESFWEEKWPNKGLMIWHYNPNGQRSDRRRKTIDLESADGLYEWNFGPNPPQRTSTSDSETGFDSLDIRGVYEGVDRGGPSYFFKPGGNEIFSPSSNPSSDAYRSNSPYAQNVFTDIVVVIKNQQGNNMILDLLTDAPPAAPISANLRIQYFACNHSESVDFQINYLILNPSFVCIFPSLTLDSQLAELNIEQIMFLATNYLL